MKKIKKVIVNWLIGQVMKRWGTQIINRWVYFTLNYPMHDFELFFERIYGKNLGKHLYEKFNQIYEDYGSRAVVHRFWVEMSDNNRKKLFDAWFLRDYIHNDYYKGDWGV